MSTADDIETALHLLSRLGLTVTDLHTDTPTPGRIPTLDDYVATVTARVNSSTARNYGTYWRFLQKHWGHRPLDEPSASEYEGLVETYRRQVKVRANSREGRGAARMFVAALRCLYRHAVRDGLVPVAANPAAEVRKPAAPRSSRYALTSEQVNELARVAATTGDDPELDALIMRIHIETACRRGGTLNLRVSDLDTQYCQIKLREKGGTERWQPISPQLTHHLAEHIRARGGPERTERLLRYRNGRPVGRHRYDSP